MARFILILTLFATFTLNAQVLELDNKEIPLNPSSNLSIDPLTGNIIVNSLDGNLSCSNIVTGNGNKPIITNFSATAVNPGGSPLLSWTILNSPTNCIKSGGWTGELPTNNDGVVIDSAGTSVAGINSSTVYSLHCSNCYGATTVQSTTANIINNDPPNVNLKVNGLNSAQIDDGSSATLSWAISNANNITCIKTGPWPATTGVITASGNDSTGSLVAVNSPYEYGLECHNNGNTNNTSGLQAATVTVGNVLPAGCSSTSDPVNPAGLQRDMRRTIYIAGDVDQSSTVTINDQTWPALSSAIRTKVNRGQYLALEFRTDATTNLTASLQFAGAPLPYGPPATGLTYSISECSGDFRQSLAKCNSRVDTGTLLFSTDPQYNSSQICKLEKNKNYFINIVHSSNPWSFTASECASGELYCGTMLWTSP